MIEVCWEIYGAFRPTPASPFVETQSFLSLCSLFDVADSGEAIQLVCEADLLARGQQEGVQGYQVRLLLVIANCSRLISIAKVCGVRPVYEVENNAGYPLAQRIYDAL